MSDLVVAAVLLVLALPISVGLVRGAAPWVIVAFGVLSAALAASLVWRRVHAVGSFWVASGVMLGLLALPNLSEGPSVIFVPLSTLYLVMIYTVAAETGARALPLAVSAVGLALVVARTTVDPPEPLDWPAFWAFVVAAVAAVGASWAFGSYHHARRQLRDRQLREGIRRERELIAREVHDVVAHSLAVMVTQADAALLVMDRDPQRARDMVGTALRTGREAMAEMRGVLSLLREESPSVRPVESLEDLESLAASFRSEEVRVDLDVTGDDGAHGEVARAAYRIIQESLTNALKHSRRPLVCRVSVEVTRDTVRVSVRDDGPGIEATRSGRDGFGITGMRERVRSLAGSLEVSSSGNGTEVVACLPNT